MFSLHSVWGYIVGGRKEGCLWEREDLVTEERKMEDKREGERSRERETANIIYEDVKEN